MFLPGVVAPSPPASSEALWFVFRQSTLLVRDGTGAPLPSNEEIALLIPKSTEPHYVGSLDGVPCFALALADGSRVPDGFSLAGLRPLYVRLPEALWKIAGRAVQIVEWDRTHRFCGACGGATARAQAERARRCDACELTVYPRLSPAIIVLVRRGDEALLARSSKFPDAFYSTLAGFVEPGESLEETVVREVAEEVGIQVDGVRYFGSQPWPFPNSLMIGFTARHAGGEARADGVELAEAAWFRADALPRIPPRASIARQLIDAWVEEVRAR